MRNVGSFLKQYCLPVHGWFTISSSTLPRMQPHQTDKVFRALEKFRIELPSWGFANTGTRFGKFLQAAAATSIDEKFSDAGQVHALTGICPSVALHVLWDFPEGVASTGHVSLLADKYGVRPGAINPNYFQEQIYKHGSFGSPEESTRTAALRHTKRASRSPNVFTAAISLFGLR